MGVALDFRAHSLGDRVLGPGFLSRLPCGSPPPPLLSHPFACSSTSTCPLPLPSLSWLAVPLGGTLPGDGKRRCWSPHACVAVAVVIAVVAGVAAVVVAVVAVAAAVVVAVVAVAAAVVVAVVAVAAVVVVAAVAGAAAVVAVAAAVVVAAVAGAAAVIVAAVAGAAAVVVAAIAGAAAVVVAAVAGAAAVVVAAVAGAAAVVVAAVAGAVGCVVAWGAYTCVYTLENEYIHRGNSIYLPDVRREACR